MRASGFVEERGGALAKLRMRVLFGLDARDALVAHLAAQQLASGAFPPLADAPFAGRGGAFAGTLSALAILADLRALDTAPLDGVVRYLEAAQREDGAWVPAEGAATVEVAATTAMLAAYLARSLRARPALLDAASGHVASAWAPEHVGGEAWWPLAAFAHLFANRPHELSDAALQWCGRELERGYRSGTHDALRVARVLTLCEVDALPGSRIEAGELVEPLLGRQGPDGSFGSSAAGGAAVAATLDAALAIVRLAPAVLVPGARR